jgi:uncharacterized protein
MMRIDSFCHIYTPEYLHELGHNCPGLEIVADQATGRTNIVDRISGELINLLFINSAFDGLEKRLAHMKKLKIDKQVLCAAQPTIDPKLLHVSNTDTIRLARITNDSLAKLIRGSEERFIPIAEIPVLDVDEALFELDRAINELGMKGIQLNTTIGGKPLDSREFRPIFAKASKMNVPILIHPCTVAQNQRRDNEREYSLHRIFGWPFETSLAIARLVFAGVFVENPSLKVITHHAGAMISFFANRLDFFYSRELQRSIQLPKKPLEYLRMIFHDTATEGSVASINCARDVFGTSRIVFGTDYPFRNDESVLSIIEAVNKLDATEEEKENIFGGNAIGLFAP